MSDQCAECGEPTVWEQELGSAICTNCGTLSNPSQSILASHLENNDTSGYEYTPYWNTSTQGSILKSQKGWAFAGQDKEARQRRNSIAIHEFISSITTRLSQPGVTARAQTVFDQAMSKGHYRWGRKARLTAGAAITIALREAKKNDSLKDIAYFLDVSPGSLGRAFTAVTSLLQLNLQLTDPGTHLPMLQTHLQNVIASPSSASPPLPTELTSKLTTLSSQFNAIRSTASSLSTLVSHYGTLSNLPTPPTACAILILSLEAELASSLPNAGMLAQYLGSRVGASKKIVMERYKTIYDAVEEWIREVPWLDAHERRGSRSKVAKRMVVARGLKDVIQFQEQIWERRVATITRPTLTLELGDEELADDGTESASHASEDASVLSSASSSALSNASRSRQPARRQTAYQRSIAQTSQYLLRPLSASPSVSGAPPDEDTLTHLLTVDSASLPQTFADPPTRLQMLAASRGGVTESDIPDDELFDEGELDGFLRTEEEIEVLRTAFDWNEDSEEAQGTDQDTPIGRKAKRKQMTPDNDIPILPAGQSPRKRTRRIDMDALARVLNPDCDLSDEIEVTQGSVVNECNTEPAICDRDTDLNDDAEEVVSEWRPLSPGLHGFDEDRYDT